MNSSHDWNVENVISRSDHYQNRPFPGIMPSLCFVNRQEGFIVTYLPRKAGQNYMSITVVELMLSGILFVQFKVNIDRVLPRD